MPPRVSIFACLTHPLTGNHATGLRGFDLSSNGSLRSLEITVRGISQCPEAALRFLRALLSTITSPVFSDIVIVLWDMTSHDAHFFRRALFGTIQSIYDVKPFRLVFLLEIRDGYREDTLEKLKRYIDVEAAEGGLGYLPCPPGIVVSNTQTTRRSWEGF